MKGKYSIEGIKINHDVDEKDYPPFVLEKIEEFYYKVQKKNLPWKVIEDLKKLIVKFPKVPVFKNYLANAYEILNKQEHLETILIKTVELHPDYCLGVFSLAQFYIDNDEIELAEEALKFSNNIEELFPENKIFHIIEVEHFYHTLFNLEMEKEDYENAEEIVKILDSIEGVSSEIMNNMRSRLLKERMDDFPNFFMDEDKIIEPVPIKSIEKDSSEELPILKNDILYKLYTEKLYLDKDTLDNIFDLDRDSAIEDLIKILKDAENRYYYHLDLDDEFQDFAIHALLILRELKATEALEAVLEFLRNDEDFLEFWLGDFLLEDGWEVIYSLSQDSLDTFKSFLLEPGIYSFAKDVILETMEQMTFDSSSNKSEIIKIWKECLDFYNKAKKEDNIISNDFFSFFVSKVLYFDKEIFKEGVKEMYNNEWIDEFMVGSFEDLYDDDVEPLKNESTSLEELYKRYSFN